MAEPTPPHSVAVPARAVRWRHVLAGSASLALILEVALGLRILAADAVDRYVHRGGSEQLCLFPDTIIYWGLARTIREGTTYEYVEWSDIPHFAIRTPGYPLFLAACQSVFGERTLAVRLVQGLLGVASVYLIYRLTYRIVPAVTPAITDPMSPPRRWTAPLAAAAFAALNPYYLFMSTLVLSEAVFVPLMLASLWGLAVLWVGPGQINRLSRNAGLLVALSSGAAAGLAILVRPSWGLFVPVVLFIWLMDRATDRTRVARGVEGCSCFRARSRAHDEPVVGAQRQDIRAIRADRALDGRQSVRRTQRQGDWRQRYVVPRRPGDLATGRAGSRRPTDPARGGLRA